MVDTSVSGLKTGRSVLPSPLVTGARIFAFGGKSSADGLAGALGAGSGVLLGVALDEAGGLPPLSPVPEQAAVNSRMSRPGAVV
jgi:hypothetical protein